jgi:hypothetical protein
MASNELDLELQCQADATATPGQISFRVSIAAASWSLFSPGPHVEIANACPLLIGGKPRVPQRKPAFLESQRPPIPETFIIASY